MCEFVDNVYEDKDGVWEREHGDSIQWSPGRTKAHCGLFYRTEKNAKLKQCSLQISDIFNTRSRMKELKQSLRDCYRACHKAGMKESKIRWMLMPPGSVDSGQVFLAVRYVGCGLISHIDEQFDDVVIVICCRNED